MKLSADQGRQSDEGFTLIELLVVIIIIGILAAIAIPVFLNQREKAVETSMKSDLRGVAALMETYFVNNLGYPADLTPLSGDIAISPDNTVTVEVAGAAAGTYCLMATHPRATEAIYYDSDKGGIQLPVGTACS